MSRRRFKISKQAEKDLEDIWFYLAERSPDEADKLLDEIQARFLRLLQFPEIGVAREDLAPKLRSLLLKDYLIFYRLSGRSIEIIRILHGSRDVENIFRRERS